MTAIEPTAEQLVTETLADIRQQLRDELDLCDRAAVLMAKLPMDVIHSCAICNRQLMIYGQQGRDNTLAIIKAIGGRWDKKINPSYPDRIDYIQFIRGVNVEIYAAAPPHSCKIVEEEVYVPAHNTTKRTLICH